jgi:serine acetyltransferase
MRTTPEIGFPTRSLWYLRRILHRLLQQIGLLAKKYGEPDASMVSQIWRGYGAKIAENVHIDPTCFIDTSFANLLNLHENVVVAMGSAFILHDSSINNVSGGPLKVGRIIVNQNAYIGCYSVIMPGVVIGEGSIIGAGSLVTNDVLPGAVVMGRPAKQICTVKELTLRFEKRTAESNEMTTFLDFPSQKEKGGMTPENLKAWGRISKEQVNQWLSHFEND